MCGRKPFFPGHNTQHQVQLIISFLGTPRVEELRKSPNEKCRKFIESLPNSSGKAFEDVFRDASPTAIDFLHRTLQFDPDKRATVTQALQHAYLEQLHCPEDEPIRPPLDTSDFEFERRKINIKALREELFLEVMHYYPEKRDLYVQEQAMLGQTYNIGHYRLLAPGESQYSSDEEEGP
jgi:mitogen-activated protein kinase 1/3